MIDAEYTVTIWNRWRNPDTSKDEWYRHVINRCTWDVKIVRALVGDGAAIASTYNVRIEENASYRDRRAWEDLNADGKVEFFTLSPGDLAALGNADFEITGMKPYTESDAKKKFAPDIFTIRAVKDNAKPYMMGRHYRIEGA